MKRIEVKMGNTTLTADRVKLVRDADFCICNDCDILIQTDNAFWNWTTSWWLHSKGQGHNHRTMYHIVWDMTAKNISQIGDAYDYVKGNQ